MAMTISFDISLDIEQELRTNETDLSSEVKEAFLVELYRQDRITYHQLAEALGLSRLETDGVLKRHKVSAGITAEKMQVQADVLREAMRD
jgi:predicted HTH domain antitoxin